MSLDIFCTAKGTNIPTHIHSDSLSLHLNPTRMRENPFFFFRHFQFSSANIGFVLIYFVGFVLLSLENFQAVGTLEILSCSFFYFDLFCSAWRSLRLGESRKSFWLLKISLCYPQRTERLHSVFFRLYWFGSILDKRDEKSSNLHCSWMKIQNIPNISVQFAKYLTMWLDQKKNSFTYSMIRIKFNSSQLFCGRRLHSSFNRRWMLDVLTYLRKPTWVQKRCHFPTQQSALVESRVFDCLCALYFLPWTFLMPFSLCPWHILSIPFIMDYDDE